MVRHWLVICYSHKHFIFIQNIETIIAVKFIDLVHEAILGQAYKHWNAEEAHITFNLLGVPLQESMEMASGLGGLVIRYVGLMWSLSYGKCAPGPCFLVVLISTYTQKKEQKGSIHDKSKSFPGHMTEVIIMYLI